VSSERAVQGDPSWDADLKRARAILKGDESEWAALADEYKDKVLKASLRLCSSLCQRWCPFEHQSSAGVLRPSSTTREVCEQLIDIYGFIYDRIRNKCLRAYKGRCALKTFLYPLLHPKGEKPEEGEKPKEAKKPRGSHASAYDFGKLCADYLRERWGRIRAPAAVGQLSRLHARVFEQVCYGRNDETIAVRLRLSERNAASLPRMREEIARALEDGGTTNFLDLLRFRRQSSEVLQSDMRSADDDEDPIAAAQILPDQERAAAALAAGAVLKSALMTLPTEERAVLWLRYREGQSQQAVANALLWPLDAVRRREASALKRLSERLPDLGASPSGDLRDLKDGLKAFFALVT
jgi:RNA polymerase sigma factor (sigma-70 family)